LNDSRFRTIDLPGTPTTIFSHPHLTGALFPARVSGVFGLSNSQITGTFLDSSNVFRGFLGVLGIPEKDRTRELAHVGVLHP
jgi:hypothetical protein